MKRLKSVLALAPTFLFVMFSCFVFSQLVKEPTVRYYYIEAQSAVTTVSSASRESSDQEQKFSSSHSSDMHKSVYPAYKYIGNRYSRKFHRPDCSYLPEKKNRVYLRSREQALSRRYIPCQKCRP